MGEKEFFGNEKSVQSDTTTRLTANFPRKYVFQIKFQDNYHNFPKKVLKRTFRINYHMITWALS